MDVRNIVVEPSIITTAEPSATRASSSSRQNCQAINLPAGGILYIPGADPVTLTATAAYKPLCLPTGAPNIVTGSGAGTVAGDPSDTTSTSSLSADNSNITSVDVDASAESTPQYSDFRDPFYASSFPQCYALASTTVIAYTLVIMLFITPRSFLDGGVVVLGRRGFTNGGSGGKNIGGRPWLQKVAALTVAISLTIATADTFRVAETQYSWGIQNAKEMQEEVLDGTELKVIRIISDTFLWLAQAQTLIRLFPRQREKVIIKWTAFSLITLDLIFDCLNSFLYTGTGHSFTEAIPALSYLFELALNVLYAAWVIYYSLMKKRYAYYHPRMRNICLVAALSLLAILVPVVFFVLDICKPDFTGWGDYVLWVGAAAASVIVWEWVERIEALEREEKKDGILGREVFDGDEMLDIMPSDFSWPRRRRKAGAKDGRRGGDAKDVSKDGSEDGDDDSRPGGGDGLDKAGARTTVRIWPSMSTFASRYRLRPWAKDPEAAAAAAAAQQPTVLRDLASIPRTNAAGAVGARDNDANPTLGTIMATGTSRSLQPPLWPARPAPAATPVSRTDTASADSTVYVMRYHPVTDSNPGSAMGTHPTTVPVSLSRSSSTSTTSSSSHGGHQLPRTTMSFMSSQSESPSALASVSPPQQQQKQQQRDSNGGDASRGGSSTKRWRSLAHALPFRRGGAASGLGSNDSNNGNNEDFGASSIDRSREGGASPTSLDDNRLQHEEGGRWDIRARLEEFAVTQAERLRERIRPTVDTTGLPVMVIPAPQRQGAMLARVLEEEENNNNSQQPGQPGQPVQPHAQYGSGSGTGATTTHSADHSGVQPSLWRSNSDTSASMMSSISRRGAPVQAAPRPTGSLSRHGPPAEVAAALSRTGSNASSLSQERPV
ncbi:pH-response regulator protein palH/rim21 [Sporothrix curviconia]|uniref:PH-response regulator protein palH/rim21 n=1 Tax=Sporothrix curviconia TaxID=1260050 RepID=A0ABP0C5L4_9PEZI